MGGTLIPNSAAPQGSASSGTLLRSDPAPVSAVLSTGETGNAGTYPRGLQ